MLYCMYGTVCSQKPFSYRCICSTVVKGSVFVRRFRLFFGTVWFSLLKTHDRLVNMTAQGWLSGTVQIISGFAHVSLGYNCKLQIRVAKFPPCPDCVQNASPPLLPPSPSKFCGKNLLMLQNFPPPTSPPSPPPFRSRPFQTPSHFFLSHCSMFILPFPTISNPFCPSPC